MVFAPSGQENVYIQGKVSWVKYVTPDPMFNKWSVTIHPNSESLEIIRELQTQGVKNQFKKDEDGYYIQFSRPTDRKIKGKVVPLAPPVCLNQDGTPMEGVAIGNGSDATVKLEVYQHATPTGGKAKAARFAGLKIDNLIPFNKDTDFPDPAMKEQAAGLDEQPEQLF